MLDTDPQATPQLVISKPNQPGLFMLLRKATLRAYILLITILVAFLEATAQKLRPMQPPVVMGLSGISRNLSTPNPL